MLNVPTYQTIRRPNPEYHDIKVNFFPQTEWKVFIFALNLVDPVYFLQYLIYHRRNYPILNISYHGLFLSDLFKFEIIRVTMAPLGIWKATLDMV